MQVYLSVLASCVAETFMMDFFFVLFCFVLVLVLGFFGGFFVWHGYDLYNSFFFFYIDRYKIIVYHF